MKNTHKTGGEELRVHSLPCKTSTARAAGLSPSLAGPGLLQPEPLIFPHSAVGNLTRSHMLPLFYSIVTWLLLLKLPNCAAHAALGVALSREHLSSLHRHSPGLVPTFLCPTES